MQIADRKIIPKASYDLATRVRTIRKPPPMCSIVYRQEVWLRLAFVLCEMNSIQNNFRMPCNLQASLDCSKLLAGDINCPGAVSIARTVFKPRISRQTFQANVGKPPIREPPERGNRLARITARYLSLSPVQKYNGSSWPRRDGGTLARIVR